MININSYLFIYSQSYNLWKKFLHAAIHLYSCLNMTVKWIISTHFRRKPDFWWKGPWASGSQNFDHQGWKIASKQGDIKVLTIKIYTKSSIHSFFTIAIFCTGWNRVWAILLESLHYFTWTCAFQRAPSVWNQNDWCSKRLLRIAWYVYIYFYTCLTHNYIEWSSMCAKGNFYFKSPCKTFFFIIFHYL